MPMKLFDIRPMTPADLDAVLAVERQCYAHPWSAGFFLQELANPLATVDLLWIEGALAGYLCSWRVDGELHILNLATAPLFRRHGIGSALLRRAFSHGIAQGVEKAFLEVRVSNEAAIDLYRHFGFRTIFRRPCYYPDGEDAWVMERDFAESAPRGDLAPPDRG
ncbi:MAG: ribosomal protein S18-alanine N-acetyltransferase [Desulfuromonadales bacterium]|nr:ribosomal protein S18-alanine N-acetyltransferase [Desulfuromonadales bacterium]